LNPSSLVPLTLLSRTMFSSDETLVGDVVQKSSYATTSFGGFTGFTAPTAAKRTSCLPAQRVLGRVLEQLPGSQRLYHVVYEDGDEAFLPAEEIRTWSAKTAHTMGNEPVYKRCASPQRKKTAMLQRTSRLEQRLGRVVGPAPALPSGELAYHVVYEDGNEAVLPKSEVKLWQAAGRGITGPPPLMSAPAPHPPLLASEGRMPYHTAQHVTSPSSIRQPITSSAMAPVLRLGQWGRRSQSLSQGPMPPREWPVHYCEVWTPNGPKLVPCEEWRWSVVPVQTYPLGWRLTQGLFLVLFALMVFSSMSKAADIVGGWRPLEDLCWWVGAPAVPATRLDEDLLGSLGASWAAANIDRASMY